VFLTAEWPGNIRELEYVVKQYVILGSAETIIADLEANADEGATRTGGALSLKMMRRNAVRNFEYKAILTTLNRHHWNRRNAAQELHMSYRSLLYAMKQLGLSDKRSTTGEASPDHRSGEIAPPPD
jgi:DNA-binding NtrC family response regulator